MSKLFSRLILSLCLASPILLMANTIKIGIAGPFTGPYAAFGTQMWYGAEQAAKDINAQGGINGDKIELIKADDACEPKQAVSVAHRLVDQDNVTAIIGHFCSSSTIPASQVYADAQALMITPGSTNPLVTERGLKTIFRTCGRDDQQGLVAARFVHDSLKAKQVAVIHDKDTYGKGLADAMKASIEKMGTKVVLYEGLTRGEKDFNALVTKIKNANADAVYFGGLHTEAGPLLRQLREQGSKIPFISGDGIVSEDFVSSAGGPQMVKGVYMTFSADPRQNKNSQAIITEFKKNGIDPEGYTLYTYATMQALAQAIKETKSMNGQKLADWLHQNSVQTVVGPKSWDEKGDLKTADYVIYEWNDKGTYQQLQNQNT
ncbi:MAG: branched-chain amino acid ABC transporter substrate-binding protein [Proteobacteria bacterium]|nr:branched-chain amino acid ABC transporter substrate-binding protein [Pseudomonadota bacterium]